MMRVHRDSRQPNRPNGVLLGIILILAMLTAPTSGTVALAASIPGTGTSDATLNADPPTASVTRLATPGIEIGEDLLSDPDFLVGDLNNDNLPDIVTGWFGIRVLENTGDPFSSNWTAHTAAYADNAMPKAIADVTKNNYNDIIGTRRTSPYSIGLWANDGTPFDGAWSGVTLATMPAHVSSIAVADINQDGRMEIVAGVDAGTSSELNAIYALYCEGDNPMTDTWRLETLATVTYAINVVKIGDLDQDTWPDIVFGTVHAPAVGSLENPVDDSEWPDVYQLRGLHNNGDDTWTAYDLGRDPAYFTLSLQDFYHGFWGASINDLVLTDVDGDTDLDVVVGEGVEGDFNLAVWQNDGTPFDGNQWEGTAIGVGELGYYMADTIYGVDAADLDGDGWMDVASGSGTAEDSEVNYWTSSEQPFGTEIADTHWVRHDIEELGRRVDDVRLTDFDGDGNIDLAGLVAPTSWGDPHTIMIWQNITGLLATVATDVSPEGLQDGESAVALEVQAANHYVPGGDSYQFDTWDLTLLDGSGTALTALQAGSLLASLTIYADTDSSGTWNAGDAELATMTTFAPSSGVVTLSFTPGDTAVAPDEVATYWVVPTLQADATSAGVTRLQIRFDPDTNAAVSLVGGGTTPELMATSPVAATLTVLQDPASLDLEVSPTEMVADGTSTAAITVTVRDSEGSLVPGGFAIAMSANLGTLPATITTTTGVATATLTAGFTSGVGAVSAALGTITATQAITLSADAVATVTVTAEADELVADGSDSTVITATLEDSAGNPVSNDTPVTFTTTLGSLGAAPYETSTTGGVATATLTAGTTLGDAVVLAQSGDITDSITIPLVVGAASSVNVTASRTSMSADGGATTGITVAVRDSLDRAVADGTAVTLTTDLGDLGADPFATTTTDGIATGTLTAGTTAGTATVQALANGITDTVTIDLLPGAASGVDVSASRSSMPADGASTATITVTVKDDNDNPVADGTAVTLTTDLGDLGADPFTTTTTDGTAIGTLTAGTSVGTATVQARVDGITNTTSISLVAGAASGVDVSASRSSMPADGSSTATITVTVKDDNDNPVADGTAVTLTTDLGDLGADPFTTTTTDGIATGTLTAGTTAGTATVQAEAEGVTNTVTIDLLPGAAGSLEVTVSRNTVAPHGTAIVTATVEDSNGNAVADGTVVTFTTNLGEFPSDPYEATTTDGVAMATFTAGSSLGTATVHVAVDDLWKERDIEIDLGIHVWMPFIMQMKP